MKKKSILIVTILFVAMLSLFGETDLYRSLSIYNYASMRNRDSGLPLQMRLDKWFPYHSRLNMGDSYYLTTPYFRGVRSDFYIRFGYQNTSGQIIPDTTATFADDTITFRNGESIPAHHLSTEDFNDIKGQLAFLNVLFRSLGTPVPDMMLGNWDDIETWVIIYDGESKERVIMESFTETIRTLSLFYEGDTAYFQFKDIKKINSRLEFFGTLFMRDRRDNVVDYADVRFHTDRLNQIDLVMFFIYRDVKNSG